MQQTIDRVIKASGHDSFSLASQMVVTELTRLSNDYIIADGLFNDEIQVDVQLLQECIRLHPRHSSDIRQLH